MAQSGGQGLQGPGAATAGVPPITSMIAAIIASRTLKLRRAVLLH
jgi:hypothetical protein